MSARNLTRLVAQSLVKEAGMLSGTREGKLEQFLDAGVVFLKPNLA
jgi:hypothetical protein